MILSDELWMIDEASLVTLNHNSWNFENNLLLHSTPFTPDNNLPQSHAWGFLKNPTTPEMPRDNPERHSRDPTLAEGLNGVVAFTVIG